MQGPWLLDLGPSQWHCKAAQMNLLSTSTVPVTKLWQKSSIGSCFMPWVMLASVVQGPWLLALGSPKWHCKAVQMNLL